MITIEAFLSETFIIDTIISMILDIIKGEYINIIHFILKREKKNERAKGDKTGYIECVKPNVK